MLPQIFSNLKGKKINLEWRKLSDITLVKGLKLTPPTKHTSIMYPLNWYTEDTLMLWYSSCEHTASTNREKTSSWRTFYILTDPSKVIWKIWKRKQNKMSWKTRKTEELSQIRRDDRDMTIKVMRDSEADFETEKTH